LPSHPGKDQIVTNFAEELASAATDAPDRPAVRLDAQTLTYAALEGAVARAVGVLRDEGVGVGDRVGILLPNVPYFPIVYYAVLRLGAVVVPMNPLLKAREVAYHLSDAGAEVLLAWQGFETESVAGAAAAGARCTLVTPGDFEDKLAAVKPVTAVADRSDDDAAVIIYTSGTTGKPKVRC